VRLKQVIKHPLILYERGSTGRQHVLDAFHERGLSPRVALETTSTETIVSMVESGLGVSVVPLMPNGAVTRGRRVSSAANVGLLDDLRARFEAAKAALEQERRARESELWARFRRALQTGRASEA